MFQSVSLAETKPDAMAELVGITPHISEQVDASLQFTDSNGVKGSLQSFLIPGKPSIIVPVYYDCPRLCGLVTNGVFEGLKQVPFIMGQDYSLTFISIDPREGVELASKRKASRVQAVSADGISGDQFKFLVGEADPVRAVMTSLGFHYKPDGEKDFSHSAAIMILSPSNKITHYFTGIEFNPRDLRLSLVESSEGQVGTFVDHMLLYCFRFDPTKGKYTWFALNVMKAGGILTLIALAALYGTMWKKYRV